MSKLVYFTGDIALVDNLGIEECISIQEVLKKLHEYEIAEEEGLLLRLSVAEGSIVFVIATIYDCDHYMDCPLPYDKNKCDADIPCEHEHRGYRIKETKFNHCMLPNIGKTVFLTKEEAEQKLAEMRGDSNG
jgi:hypothetical protein